MIRRIMFAAVMVTFISTVLWSKYLVLRTTAVSAAITLTPEQEEAWRMALNPPPAWKQPGHHLYYLSDLRFLGSSERDVYVGNGFSGHHMAACAHEWHRVANHSMAHVALLERERVPLEYAEGLHVAWFAMEPQWKWEALRKPDSYERIHAVGTYRLHGLDAFRDRVPTSVAQLPYVPLTFAPHNGWQRWLRARPEQPAAHPGLPWAERVPAVLVVMSNCQGWRLQIVMRSIRQLAMAGVPVHVYGGCFRAEDAAAFYTQLRWRTNVWVQPRAPSPCVFPRDVPPRRLSLLLKDKMCMLERYRVVLSFEAERDVDYVSEKFFMPFQAGAVSVYMGAPNAKQLQPGPKSMIHVEDYVKLRPRAYRGDPSDLTYATSIELPEALLDEVKRVVVNRATWLSYQAWRRADAPSPGYAALERHSLEAGLCRLVALAWSNNVTAHPDT